MQLNRPDSSKSQLGTMFRRQSGAKTSLRSLTLRPTHTTQGPHPVDCWHHSSFCVFSTSMVYICASLHASDQGCQVLCPSELASGGDISHLQLAAGKIASCPRQHFGRSMCCDQNILGSRRGQSARSSQTGRIFAAATKYEVGASARLQSI